jgi:hypothetical protein
MQFLARVEIHNADLQTYYRLHAAMEAESFSRVITGANDFKQYKMPIGTYWTEAFDDSWEALTAAQRAALPIDTAAQIVLFGAGQILFQNCKQYVKHPVAELPPFLQNDPYGTLPRLTGLRALGALKSSGSR